MKEIAIYGAGGFGREVACVIDKINSVKNTWQLVGFFDDGIIKGTRISHFGEVLGGISELNRWSSPIGLVFAIGNPKIIKLLVGSIANPNVHYPNIIHPDVAIADELTLLIGRGNVVLRGCSFSCDVTIGDFNQFNSISALAHDVVIRSYNVLMPLVRISGEVKIGECNFFGIGAIVLQRVRIGNKTRIGAGSVVITNTKDGFLYLGNPATRTNL